MKKILIAVLLAVSLVGCSQIEKFIKDPPSIEEIQVRVDKIEKELRSTELELRYMHSVGLVPEDTYQKAMDFIQERKANISLVKALLKTGRAFEAEDEVESIEENPVEVKYGGK